MWNFFGNRRPLSIERMNNGSFFTTYFSSRRARNTMATDAQKISVALSNASLLKALSLNSDLCSQASILLKGKPIQEVYTQPNPFQTWNQWLYDFMFWHQLGTARLFYTDTNLSKANLYWLDPSKLNSNMYNDTDHLIEGKSGVNAYNNQVLDYMYKDGTVKKIKRSSIVSFFSISNGVSGDWFGSNSKIDSIYKVIQNSEKNLDTTYQNLSKAGLFSYSNKQEGLPTMGDKDRLQQLSVEQSVESGKTMFTSSSPVIVDRFANNIDKLYLEGNYLHNYFIITSMFGIPRDVAEARLNGATNVNVDSAIGRHVEYSLVSPANSLAESLNSLFGEDISISWSKLSFNQGYELTKQNVIKQKLENLQLATNLNVKIKDLDKLTE